MQTIPKRNQYSPCALSFAQEMLWFLNQLQPDSRAYNQPKAFRLSGVLNRTALQEALDALVARHEALRTTFPSSDGNPAQVIAPFRSIDLLVIDLSGLADGDRQAELNRNIVELSNQPFDLSRDLMLRAGLFCLNEADHVILLVVHHIASDGWSMGVLFRELSVLYKSFCTGEPSPLSELPIQYADYAVWQRQCLQGEAFERHLSYWKAKLAGVSPLELPTDRARPAIQTFRGGRQSLMLPKRLLLELKDLARSERMTLFMVLLAGFQTLLYRYTRNEDIAVGSPITGRTRMETEGLIGFFVNTLVLRSDLSGNPTFRGLLKRVRDVALGAFMHPDVPFEKLLAELKLERSLSRNTMFQVMFALQNYPRHAIKLPGLVVEPVDIEKGTAKFELTLSASEEQDGLGFLVEYNADLFENRTVERMLGHFANLLEAIVTNPEVRISDLPLLNAAERDQLLLEWNKTAADTRQDVCVQQLFEEQAARTPDAVAVVFEKQQLTYRELDNRANQLAHYLKKHSVGPDEPVGICLEPSLDLVVGLLGIIKAGGVYLPLDPALPQDRLSFILKDTKTRLVITHNELRPALAQLKQNDETWLDQNLNDSRRILLCLDSGWQAIAEESVEKPETGVAGDNLVYIMYTSGSTGEPKGVMISHGALCNRLLWGQAAYELTETDRVLQWLSIGFDFSVWEFFTAFMAGARVVIAAPAKRHDAAHLAHLIAEEKITIAGVVPSMLQLLLQEQGLERCSSLKKVMCGGEILPPELQERFFSHFNSELQNTYGPTEAAIDVTCWICRRGDDADPVPIGRPIANTQIYVLDSYSAPVPTGSPGEIHIGGLGLARGYLDRPELTADKFIPDPFSGKPGARLYKTGDLARYLSDGSMEFLGRVDDQIKMRGYRIEPGEIESVLGQHPAVQKVVVLARDDTDADSAAVRAGKRLVAYIVPRPGANPKIDELRSFAKRKLPKHMVPAAFLILDALPLSPSGKVDRKALPAPDQSRPELEGSYAAPRSPVEEMIAEIWAEILNLSTVGIHDNFFDLGGHSLLATQAISRVCQALKLDIPLRVLFERPTVAELASEIEEGRQRYDVSPPPKILAIPRQLRFLNL
jgi:amino acid adenylation domain-containing protein